MNVGLCVGIRETSPFKLLEFPIVCLDVGGELGLDDVRVVEGLMDDGSGELRVGRVVGTKDGLLEGTAEIGAGEVDIEVAKIDGL